MWKDAVEKDAVEKSARLSHAHTTLHSTAQHSTAQLQHSTAQHTTQHNSRHPSSLSPFPVGGDAAGLPAGRVTKQPIHNNTIKQPINVPSRKVGTLMAACSPDGSQHMDIRSPAFNVTYGDDR